MDIYKIDSGLPLQRKIELLNDMILALNGKIEQGKFDINELDDLFDQNSAWTRRFARNVLLGNSFASYTGWSHVHAQSGYSIWKLAPSNYVYNALNKLYFDDKLVENRGEADTETLSSFDSVQLYDGDLATYSNLTTEAATEGGTEFELMDSSSDYLYIGSASQFGGVAFEFATRGSGYELLAEYWNGSAWMPLEFSGNAYTDDTNEFASDGTIRFDIPGDWATRTVNSVASKYWIRLSHDGSASPVTVAEAYLIVPANSVIALLTLSSDEFFKENWAWCSYGGYVYVTIRNTGVAAYEGNAFIQSGSSTVNKQNFFVSNHEFKADYEQS